jgi:hypothetical protein
MEFIRHQPDRDGRWKAWLATTAQREAWKLDGKERSHIGFEIEGRPTARSPVCSRCGSGRRADRSNAEGRKPADDD